MGWANLYRQKVDSWLLGIEEAMGCVTAKAYGISFGSDENFLKLNIGGGCMILRIC